ncbi:PstS family phosphate ABC transporter substrate-binding protein [Candidatus Mycoplasma mahonii]|uniref:PstS family phosphate ABC transporter substrate-binding protein n=1 Tax=Candidatus Mycoplasma mahonii TaxID=3004105 RepID=UPI0026ECB236|nr:hypothetical protein [Candidatus Mycoplasma mahonii]WKX02445.1 hypothetical protein O3I44_03580 [Candidatus Mycoplasma mahonii]
MNKFKKIGIGVVTLGLLSTPIIAIIVSKSLSKEKSGIEITGVGSSSVQPLINEISKKTIYNIQYTANGSGAGLESQSEKKILSYFGMMSSLKTPGDDNKIANWKKHKVRTITWAIDAIGISVKLPSSIKIINNERPIIDIQELSKLYDVDSAANTTWGKLLTNETKTSTGLDAVPLAFGRQGGKSASGTADGFWHQLGKNIAPGTQADKDHKYLPKVQQTPEANSVALNVVVGKSSGLTYISLGYALENEKSSGTQVATITNTKDGTNWVPTMDNVKNGSYKWIRPFNMSFSIKNKDSIKFAWFLFSLEVQEIIKNLNFVPLTSNQILWQANLSKTDEELKKEDVLHLATKGDFKHGLEI